MKPSRRGLRRTGPQTMGWDTKHEFPRNWPTQRKLYDACVLLFLEFYTAAISSTGPSAAEEAMSEYAMSRVVMLTGFQFALGRRQAYLVSAAAYGIAGLLIGVIPSPAGVFIGRFLAGYVSVVPAIVLAGSFEDLYAQQPGLWLLWT
ncbi:hypothetical protein N7468_010757 [Penicillium chermesinum]|uniref:Major facilitator superfamily (MFS) profile domain-containing protein n=1 Tax=Penicillium chermesinum TaxID=63820 RepID=A0A9W9N9S2_9EURO|nr:uncharacterized protein N7468_010757 [Penicillium chermesinum]KAJ5215078.1 hypothetical protein N7468_010757 [Penicillium chermesinum]